MSLLLGATKSKSCGIVVVARRERDGIFMATNLQCQRGHSHRAPASTNLFARKVRSKIFQSACLATMVARCAVALLAATTAVAADGGVGKCTQDPCVQPKAFDCPMRNMALNYVSDLDVFVARACARTSHETTLALHGQHGVSSNHRLDVNG